MGIEPTNRTVHVRLNGFEDRGHHQVCKHFQSRCHGNAVAVTPSRVPAPSPPNDDLGK